MNIEELLKQELPSEHKHSGHETLMSRGANACPICQALKIQSLESELSGADQSRLNWAIDHPKTFMEICHDAFVGGKEHETVRRVIDERMKE